MARCMSHDAFAWTVNSYDGYKQFLRPGAPTHFIVVTDDSSDMPAAQFVPMLTATGFHTLAWILTGFLVISGVIGLIGAPRNEGKSLDQLEAEMA